MQSRMKRGKSIRGKQTSAKMFGGFAGGVDGGFMEGFKEQMEMRLNEMTGRAADDVHVPKAVTAEEDDLLAILETNDVHNQHVAACIISPRSTKKMYWDLLVGLFIVWSVVLLPFRIAFEVPSTG